MTWDNLNDLFKLCRVMPDTLIIYQSDYYEVHLQKQEYDARWLIDNYDKINGIPISVTDNEMFKGNPRFVNYTQLYEL